MKKMPTVRSLQRVPCVSRRIVTAIACLWFAFEIRAESAAANEPVDVNVKKHYRATILKGVFKKLPLLREIYHSRRRGNPDLFGELIVGFTVDASGAVVGSSVFSSSMKDSVFDTLVRRHISSWTFGPAGFMDTTEVSYPFIFYLSDTIPPMLLRLRKIDVSKRGPRESSRLGERIDTLTNALYFEWCKMNNDSIRGSLGVEVTITPQGEVERLAVIENSIDNVVFFIKALQTIESFDFQKDTHSAGTELRWRFSFDKEKLICP